METDEEKGSIAALALWQCLTEAQRTRLVSSLRLEASSCSSSSSCGPAANAPPLDTYGVPGYVDVGVSEASAGCTLAVRWRLSDEDWQTAQDQGASLCVCLRNSSDAPCVAVDASQKKEDGGFFFNCLPIICVEGKAQFPPVSVSRHGSLCGGVEACLVKLTNRKTTQEGTGAKAIRRGEGEGEKGDDDDNDDDDDDDDDDDCKTVIAQSEMINLVTGTLERTWSVQLEKVSIVLNSARMGKQAPAARSSLAASKKKKKSEYGQLSVQDRETLFISLWQSLGSVERKKLMPHLTPPATGHQRQSEDAARKRADDDLAAQQRNKKAVAGAAAPPSDAPPSEGGEEERSWELADWVVVPNDNEKGEDATEGKGSTGKGAQQAGSTVSLSFVEASTSIKPSVVWNLTATEYYDWISLVDADTKEAVAKISINSLFSWTNPVAAYSWSQTLTTLAKEKGLSKKYYAVMWRWHEEESQYRALGYSSNILRTVVSIEKREERPSTQLIDPNFKQESLVCAQLACAAYRCYENIQGALPPPLDCVFKINNASTDTQGFVSIDKLRGIAYVAFKGSWEITDFLNDADFSLSAFVTKPLLKAQAKMVACWESVKEPLIKKLLEYLQAKTVIKLTLTGHSLGAALSCMMMECILHDARFKPYKLNSTSLNLISFACPRSFDWASHSDSKEQMDQERATMLNFVDENDLVATGVWGYLKYFGYYHVGSVMLLEGTGHSMSNYIELIKKL